MHSTLRQNLLLLLTGLFLLAQFAMAYHNFVHPVEPQFLLAKHTGTDGDHHSHKNANDDCNICAASKDAAAGSLLASITLHLPTLLALSIETAREDLLSLTFAKAYNAQAPPVLS
jgi:hypothetical protein